MADESTAVAESSPAPAAEPEAPVLPRSGTSEYAEWRHNGKLPDPKPKVEPSASSETPAADSGESPAPQQQERTGKPKTEKRFQQLLSERDQLKRELEAFKAPKAAVDQPKPAQQTQQPAVRVKPTIEAKNPDGTHKYATYEDFTEDLADWKAEQRIEGMKREQFEQGKTRELSAKVDAARERYGKEKVDEVIFPTSLAIRDNPAIPTAVKAMIGDSEIFPDLMFTLGNDPKELASFIEMAKNQPGKALRYVAKVEDLIQAELGKNVSRGTAAATGRDAAGKFTATESATPAKRGPESAPEPPLEIGHRGTGPMDESAAALSRAEKGDSSAFRAWKIAEDRKALARRRGV